jgi:hypothetical protein
MTISTEVRALTDRFLETPVEGTITFADMSKAIGKSIHARRWIMQRVLHIASRESGAIFSSVRGVGYKRLSAEEASVVGSHARTRIRRTSRKASLVISRAVEMANQLSENGRRSAYREISSLQLLQHISTDKSVKATEQADDKPQPVAFTMKAMMDQIVGSPKVRLVS